MATALVYPRRDDNHRRVGHGGPCRADSPPFGAAVIVHRRTLSRIEAFRARPGADRGELLCEKSSNGFFHARARSGCRFLGRNLSLTLFQFLQSEFADASLSPEKNAAPAAPKNR